MADGLLDGITPQHLAIVSHEGQPGGVIDIGMQHAGQHGVATATVCALMGIACIVYMGVITSYSIHYTKLYDL